MSWPVFPTIHPEWARMDRAPRRLWGFYLPFAVVAYAVSMLPPVRAWTGLDPRITFLLIAIHIAGYAVYVHTRLFDRHPTAFSSVIIPFNFAVTIAFAAFSHRPDSPLWAVYLLACLFFSQAAGPAWLVAGVVAAAPLTVAAGWALKGRVPLDASLGPTLTLSLIGVVTYVALVVYNDAFRHALAKAELSERRAAEAAERERVARNLHDTVGAALTEVMLWLEVAEARGAGLPEPVARARTRLREAIVELRGAVETLDGGELDTEEIAGLVRLRTEGMCEAAGVQLRVDVRGEGRSMPMRQAYQVVKIVEEATTNAIRHGRPRELRVDLELDGRLHLSVADDGAGFDPAAAAPGRGLSSMRERARSLSAGLTLYSAPGAGTRVDLQAPARPGSEAA